MVRKIAKPKETIVSCVSPETTLYAILDEEDF